MNRLPPHVRRISVVVVLGAVMSSLDTTIVNVALASLARDLDAPIDTIQWVVSAYLLSLGAVIPVGGWAVRRFGSYRVYMAALAMFALGSALCAVAGNVEQLITFRVVQGLGGGLIMPTGMTMLVRAADRGSLPQVMSAIGTPIVLAPIMGPTLGGFLLVHVGWNALFAINIPVGIIAAAAAARMLPRDVPDESNSARLDWTGLVLASVGVLAITYGFSHRPEGGQLVSFGVIAPEILGAILVALFVWHAHRAADPLLDVRLYRISSYGAATAVMFCLNAALFGSMILLPLYLQGIRELDAITTGLLLIPQGVGAALGMNRSASFERRFGTGLTSLIGMVVVATCTAPFLALGDRTSYVLISIAVAVRGFGVGLAVNPVNTAAFSSLTQRQVGDASPQIQVIGRVGATLGTAAIAVILQRQLPHHRSDPTGAFDSTYAWVLVITLVALCSSFVLWRVERKSLPPVPAALVADAALA